MTIQRDMLKYHKSISSELSAARDRIRHLIGSAHWQTDGQHKEAILRKILREHISTSYHIGTGFVCVDETQSHQIDVMITLNNLPVLYGDGDLRIVTPDSVAAIIEVKSSRCSIDKTLAKIADDIEMIRTRGNDQCLAGLFLYEMSKRNIERVNVLSAVQTASKGDKNRAINWIAFGRHHFIRFWPYGERDSNIVTAFWQEYEIKGLAHTYLLSNIIVDTHPKMYSVAEQYWFPLKEGKEEYRTLRMYLDGTVSDNEGAYV